MESLLKKLIPQFESNLISLTNKYAIEIKHKSKNIRYILEVEKSTLLVICNGKLTLYNLRKNNK